MKAKHIHMGKILPCFSDEIIRLLFAMFPWQYHTKPNRKYTAEEIQIRKNSFC